MMKIAFYRARFGDVTDKAIALGTFGPFSHCEIVFSDGFFFSSSGRDGGVRYKEIIPHDHWEIFELPIDAVQEDVIKKWCFTQIGCGYDWEGVLRLGIGLPKEDPHLWFCSEICLAAIQQADLVKEIKPYEYSPNSACEMLKKRKVI